MTTPCSVTSIFLPMRGNMPYINLSNILTPQTPPPPYADYGIIYGEDISRGYPEGEPIKLDESSNWFLSSIMGKISDAMSFLWRMLTFWKN